MLDREGLSLLVSYESVIADICVIWEDRRVEGRGGGGGVITNCCRIASYVSESIGVDIDLRNRDLGDVEEAGVSASTFCCW